MNRSAWARAVKGAAAVLLLGLLLMFPQKVVLGAQEGLRCCSEQLIPALFPFLIVCQLVMDCPAAPLLGRAFWPYLRLLRIGSPAAGAALLIGLLGGFAPAGRCVARLRENGRINSQQAQALLTACAGSGPGFVVNSVGLLMLGSWKIGWVLVGCQTIANLLCGLAAARLLNLPTLSRHAVRPALPDSETGDAVGVSGTIRQSAQAMLTICGTVVGFRCLYQILQPVFCLDARFSAAGAALLEVTNGCIEAARLPGSMAVYGCCAALSLLSASVFLQLRALVPGDVSLKTLALTRPLHLLISMGLLHFALQLLPDLAEQAWTPAEPVRIVTTRARPDAALVLFCFCCLVFFRLQKAAKPVSGPQENPLL